MTKDPESSTGPVCIIGFAPPFIAVNMAGEDRPEVALAGRVATNGSSGRLFPRSVTSDSITVFTSATKQFSVTDGHLIRAEGPGATLSNAEQIPAAMEPGSWPLVAFGPIDRSRRPAVARFWSELLDQRTCPIVGCTKWLTPGVDLCAAHLSQRLAELDRTDEALITSWNAQNELRFEHFRTIREDMDAQGIELTKTAFTWKSGLFTSLPCPECGNTRYTFEAHDPVWISIRSWVTCTECRSNYPRWGIPPEPLERPRSTPIDVVEVSPTPDEIRARERRAIRRERDADRRSSSRRKTLVAAELQTLLRVCAERGDAGWTNPETLAGCCPACGIPLKGPRHGPNGPTCVVRIYERKIRCGDWVGPTILGVDLHLNWFTAASRVWPESHQASVASHVKRASKYGTTLGHADVLASVIPGETAARTIVTALAESSRSGEPLTDVLGSAISGGQLPEPTWPERR